MMDAQIGLAVPCSLSALPRPLQAAATRVDIISPTNLIKYLEQDIVHIAEQHPFVNLGIGRHVIMARRSSVDA
jgi:hypothetical protein